MSCASNLILLHKEQFDERIEDALSYLRFLAYDGDLSLFRDNKSLWELKDGKQVMHGRGIVPFSLVNEQIAFQLLYALCESSLSKFTCSAEEDRILLQDPKLTFNQRNIIICRLEEKEILRYWMQVCSAVVNILNMPIQKARTMVTSIPPEYGPMRPYFEQHLMPAWSSWD